MFKEIAAVAIVACLSCGCFTDDFEQGGSNWSVDNGVWEFGAPTFGPPTCNQADQCAGTILGDNYPQENSRLVMPSLFLLPAFILNPAPSIEFRHWHEFGAGFFSDLGRLQISLFNPELLTWSNWTDIGTYSRSSEGWILGQVDLTPFAGRLVRLGFYHNGTRTGNTGAGWYVDDVAVPGIALRFLD